MTTIAEQRWMDAITDLGCIVCAREGRGYVPACVHHLLRGGRRIGHLHTIPLCPAHHSGGVCNDEYVSRHPFKREFERRYGTEEQLLEDTRRRVNSLATRKVA